MSEPTAGRPTVKTVSVVIPTRRRAASLTRALEAWLRVDWPHHALEILVVDDAGEQATARVVEACSQGEIPVQYLPQPHSGVATARNAGARSAAGDLLIFADDDVVVPPEHVRQHASAHERHERALVNGVPHFSRAAIAALSETPFGRYRIELERAYEAGADGRELGAGCFETEIVTARNLSLRQSLFFELGAFDASFPYAGAEDQDLSLRARAKGCALIRDHAIAVENDEPTITLPQFCLREERSAQTAVVLARKYPDRAPQIAIYTENRPIAPGDRPGLITKKLVKALLARRLALNVLDRAGASIDRLPGDQAWRRRLYAGLVGLHMFRGVRTALRATQPWGDNS